jgi:hypothetical protein
MRSAALLELERQLETRMGTLVRRSPHQVPAPTGTSLDSLLPEGGLPRGQAIEWLGPRSCGKTTFLHATLQQLHEAGESVAVIDTDHTLYAPDWATLVGEEAFWVVRPPEKREAIWCADLLLRSGAFGAVALEVEDAASGSRTSPGRSLSRSVIVRLQRLAEEAGAVFVVLGPLSLAALRLRFRPGRLQPVEYSSFGPALPRVRPVWVEVGKGRGREIPILCPVPSSRSGRPVIRDRKGPR